MALDLEFSSTLAPAADLLPTYGPCLCTNVLDDDYASLESMAKAPNIISNSWGGSEDTWPDLYGPSYDNALTMHDYFVLLDARGSTVIASSGDGGGFDTGTGILSGSFPATDPYVLSVNGLRTVAADAAGQSFDTTTAYGLLNVTIGVNPQAPISNLINTAVHADRAASIASQSYWYVPFTNTTLTNAPPEASGGFDTSYWFNQSWYEHGYNIPDLGRSLGSGVAATADFNTSIFFDGTMQFFWGGTSFACPATAGLLAVIEDYLVAHGKSAYLGNGNAVVYDRLERLHERQPHLRHDSHQVTERDQLLGQLRRRARLRVPARSEVPGQRREHDHLREHHSPAGTSRRGSARSSLTGSPWTCCSSRTCPGRS